MKTNPVTKESTFEVPNPVYGYFLIAMRYICMLSFYGGAIGVIVSIFAFKADEGPTAPVSPTVQCVVNLTCQFFLVYFMVSAMFTVSEISGGAIQMTQWRLFSAVESAKTTLAFAPMLSILFVTTRMYALLITNKKGAPQAWVQDGMFMATWSLLISFLMCLITGTVMDKVETDEDGNVVNKFDNKYVAMAVTVIRYLCMALLYGGMIMVIVGLFVMTPENANGRGSLPVVSNAIDQTPVADAPRPLNIDADGAEDFHELVNATKVNLTGSAHDFGQNDFWADGVEPYVETTTTTTTTMDSHQNDW